MEFAEMRKLMKLLTVLGILLAVLGIFTFIYQRFNYTRQKKVIDVGPIHATADRQEHVPLPPIVGGLVLGAGGSFTRLGCEEETRAGCQFVEV
jgi:uncharacterized membrane protein